MSLYKNWNLPPLHDKPLERKELLNNSAEAPWAPNLLTWPQISPALNRKFRPAYLEKLEREIIKQAKEQAQYIEKEAYERGFTQGEKNGWEMAQKRLEVLRDNWQKLLQELEGKLEKVWEENERVLIKLALELTRKILSQKLPQLEDTIVKTLQAAWQYVKDQERIIIHLHPKDYEYLMGNSAKWPFPQAEKEKGKVAMVPDATVTRGGCYLETTWGDIDATFETQFAQLVSSIWEKITGQKE